MNPNTDTKKTTNTLEIASPRLYDPISTELQFTVTVISSLDAAVAPADGGGGGVIELVDILSERSLPFCTMQSKGASLFSCLSPVMPPLDLVCL